MEKLTNKSFPFQVWAATIAFVAPVTLVIIGLVDQSLNVGFEFTLLFILFGAVFSLPALLIAFLTFRFLSKRTSSSFLVKFLFDLVVVALVWVSFWLISGSMALMLSLVYSGSLIISSFLIPVFENRLKTNLVAA